MTTNRPKIDLGPLENIVFAVFATKDRRSFYVVHKDRLLEYQIDQTPGLEWLADKRRTTAQAVRLDDWEEFYLVFSADCAFPPLYITSAQHEQDALAQVATETDAFLIEEPDLSDYDPENLNYDDNGRPMDFESAHVEPLELLQVIAKPLPPKGANQ